MEVFAQIQPLIEQQTAFIVAGVYIGYKVAEKLWESKKSKNGGTQQNYGCPLHSQLQKDMSEIKEKVNHVDKKLAVLNERVEGFMNARDR